MHVFLLDVMFNLGTNSAGRKASIPLGKADCTVLQKAVPTKDTFRSSRRRYEQTRRGKRCSARCRCPGTSEASGLATSTSTLRTL